MMDAVFDACVQILLVLAEWTGLTYQQINVWIFVILWPLLTLAMGVWILALRRRIRRLTAGPAKVSRPSGNAKPR
jgi:hypothetical protein